MFYVILFLINPRFYLLRLIPAIFFFIIFFVYLISGINKEFKNVMKEINQGLRTTLILCLITVILHALGSPMILVLSAILIYFLVKDHINIDDDMKILLFVLFILLIFTTIFELIIDKEYYNYNRNFRHYRRL